MATRFYLPSVAGGTGISPAVHADWSNGAAALFARYVMSTGRTGTAMTTFSESVAANSSECFAQFVSAPLAAQSIDGTISISMRCNCADTASGDNYRLRARIIAPDGTTVRGTIFTGAPGTGNENWSTSLVSEFATVTDAQTTSVSATAGDYLVVEIGPANLAAFTSETETMRWGDAAATDLDAADDDAGDDNPWVEFSQTIIFKAQPNQLMMMGCGT